MIVAYIREHRIPPTRREIKQLADLSSLSQVEHHVTQLRALGFITVRPGHLARGIELVEATSDHGKYQELVEIAKQMLDDPVVPKQWRDRLFPALSKVGAFPFKGETEKDE